jgi:DNA-binding transcriptional regulator YiaG
MNETETMLELCRYVQGGRAREIRRSARVPVRSIAADLGVTRTVINKWETGKVVPSSAHAAAWLNLLRKMETALGQSGE